MKASVHNYVVLSVEAELHSALLDRGAPSFFYTVKVGSLSIKQCNEKGGQDKTQIIFVH